MFIDAVGVPQAQCYTKKERYTIALDTGNAFMYTICTNLTPGNNYTFNAWLNIPLPGNIIQQYDESFNGFEVSPFPADQQLSDPVISSFNPNGTIRFNTLKTIELITYTPNVNLLNFVLNPKCYNGTFDTTNNTCICCNFQTGNGSTANQPGICQSEIEVINRTMFPRANITINLTFSNNITMTNLTMLCENYHESILKNAACQNNAPIGPTETSSTCMNWTNTTYSTTIPSGHGVHIPLTGQTGSIAFTLGTIAPNPTCEAIECQIMGTWKPGNTQNFTINKTITVTAVP